MKLLVIAVSLLIKQLGTTHYISAIKLGACEYHFAISRSEQKRLGVGISEEAGPLARVGLSTLFEKYLFFKGEEKRKIGRIDRKREEVTTEAVIGFEIQPLYKLVRVPYSRLHGQSWFFGSVCSSTPNDLCDWLDSGGEQFYVRCSYYSLFKVNGYLAAEKESPPEEDSSIGKKDSSTVKKTRSAVKKMISSVLRKMISSPVKDNSTAKEASSVVKESPAKKGASSIDNPVNSPAEKGASSKDSPVDSPAEKGASSKDSPEDSPAEKKASSTAEKENSKSNNYKITIVFSVTEEDQARMLFKLQQYTPAESDKLYQNIAVPTPTHASLSKLSPPTESQNTTAPTPKHASLSKLLPIPAIFLGITGLGLLFLYAVFRPKS